MSDYSKVKVVCRIRQSNIGETYSTAPLQQQGLGNSLRGGESIVGDKSSVQQKSILQNSTNNGSLGGGSTVLAANSSLDKDKKICIFTASSNKEKPIYVAASGNPIKSQLLQDYVKTDKNIIQYRHSILENANIFKFDHAMNPKVNNHQLYKDQCQDLVQKAMSQGISSTFILVGPAKAGKKFTMKGGEQVEKGILSRAIDSLIQLSELQSQGAGSKSTKTGNLKPGVKPFVILFSIYAIYNNEVIDLLTSNQNEDSDEEISEYELTFSGDYRKYFMKSRDRLKSVGQGEQSIRRLHVIYKFSIYRNENTGKKSKIINSPNRGLMSTLTFIHCADFNKTRLPEFTILSDYLVDIATRKDSNLLETPAYQNSKLVTQINDSLNSGQDNFCVLLCNVSGSYDYLSQSVDCLQFCAGVKERIDNYFEDINAFNQDQELINALANPQQGSIQDNQFGNSLKNSNILNNGSQFGPGGAFQGLNQANGNNNNNQELMNIAYRDKSAQFQRKRGQNPSVAEIQKDLSNLMKDIYSFSDQTQGLTQEEMNAWAVDREAELQSILQDIGKLSPENQKQFDATAVKIQESLNFLSQVKKNATRLSLSRSPSGDLYNGNNNSEDLGGLSQMNKSRQSGQGIHSNMSNGQSPNNQGSSNDYTYDNNNPNQTENGKKSLKKLRERIMEKIDEIINENDTNKRTVRVGQQRNGQKDPGDILIEKSSRNLKLLKELLTDEGYLVQEKKTKLKAENLELKNQVQDFKTHLGDIESELQEKLAKVQYLEDSKEQLVQQVERDREIIQLKLEKEEMMERNDEELRDILEKLKVKLQRRKEECSMLKANIEKAEINIAEERQIMANERESLIRQAEDCRISEEEARVKADNLENVNNRLQYELEDSENGLKKALSDLQFCEKRLENVQQMLVEEQQLGKELIVKQNMLERQVDEAEDRAQQFEHKLAKQKRKTAEEKSFVEEERDAEQAKRKEATNRLKGEVRELERIQSTMTAEIKIIKQENQRLQIASQESQAQTNNLMKQNRELQNELEKTRVEMKNKKRNQQDSTYSQGEADRKLRDENERLQNSLSKTENAMKQIDKKLVEKVNEVEQLKRDAILYDQEATGYKEQISRMSKDNRYLNDMNMLQERGHERRKSSDKGNNKSNSVNNELNDIKRENKYLKDVQVQQSNLVEELKHSAKKQDNKLQKNKQLIDNLTQQLLQFETQVNELLKQQQQQQSPQAKPIIGNVQRSASPGIPPAASLKQLQEQSKQPTRSILKKPKFSVAHQGLFDDDTDEDQSDD